MDIIKPVNNMVFNHNVIIDLDVEFMVMMSQNAYTKCCDATKMVQVASEVRRSK